MPRNELKAYTTVLARIPQELADQVKRYAGVHRCSVSELIRDGLEMRLESGDVPGRSTGRSTDHGDAGKEVLHSVLQAIKALSPMGQAEVRQTITEVLHEVLPHYVSSQKPQREGHTEVLPSEGHAAPQSRSGMTEVLPHHSRGHTAADEVIHEVLPHNVADAFDPQRFVLGRLCRGQHAYGTTGKTLYRLPKRVCPPCDAARARERRARRTAAQAQEEHG